MNDISEGKSSHSTVAWVFGNSASPIDWRYALFVLRLMIAAYFITHGLEKLGLLGGQGLQATENMVANIFKYPTLFTWLLIIAEIGGGVALLLGFATRIAAIVLAAIEIVAVTTTLKDAGYFETHVQQMLVAGCMALLIGGGGALTVYPGCGKRSKPKAAATPPAQTPPTPTV